MPTATPRDTASGIGIIRRFPGAIFNWNKAVRVRRGAEVAEVVGVSWWLVAFAAFGRECEAWGITSPCQTGT
ncbi:hypothetical protein GCM10010357_24520 [Streptomyces luteireticuli]|uniref:Uncharacterized protein n=1 Tax=Streptomyces luteireticuli TaxID=173858 RepID=A0ABN0YNM8_9ACTN